MKITRWLILSIASISLFGMACSPIEDAEEPLEGGEGIEDVEGEGIEDEGIESEAVEGEEVEGND